MAEVTVRLNGLLSGRNDKTYAISFEGNRERLESALHRLTFKIPEQSIAFFAINGTKVSKDSWVNDGDIIDVFPVVAGG